MRRLIARRGHGTLGGRNRGGSFLGRRPECLRLQWLTDGHRRAKTVTNLVTNRWGDGPDTPPGVRDRAARGQDLRAAELVERVGDDVIARAIADVRELLHRWAQVPPGGMLRLTWPLTRQ